MVSAMRRSVGNVFKECCAVQGQLDQVAQLKDPSSRALEKGLMLKTEARLLAAVQGLQAIGVTQATDKDRRLIQFAQQHGRTHAAK
jgi:hypothetical protein